MQLALSQNGEGSFGGLVGRALTFMPEVRSSKLISDIDEHFSTNGKSEKMKIKEKDARNGKS